MNLEHRHEDEENDITTRYATWSLKYAIVQQLYMNP
jgi:hypothetical protein